MAWVNIDDQFFNNHKTMQLSKDAKLLALAALCYCNANLTDGFVATSAARALAGQLGVKGPASRELVDIGMWHKREDGFDIHDYLVYQRSAATIRDERAKARERMQRARTHKRGSPRSSGERSGEQDPEQPVNVQAKFGQSSSNPKPKPYKHSSRSDLRWLPDAVAESEIETGKAEALVERVGGLLNGKAKPEQVRSLVGWAAGSLDLGFVDEVVGMCAGLSDRPRTVRYLATAIRDRASQTGVTMEPWS